MNIAGGPSTGGLAPRPLRAPSPNARCMDALTAFAACPQDEYALATRAQLQAAGLRSTDLTAAVRGGQLHRVRRRVYGLRPLDPWAEHLLSGGRVDPAYLRHARAVL